MQYTLISIQCNKATFFFHFREKNGKEFVQWIQIKHQNARKHISIMLNAIRNQQDIQ